MVGHAVITATNVTLPRWWKTQQQQWSHCSLSITAANELHFGCSWKQAGCKSSPANCVAQLNVAQMKWKEWRACRAPNNNALITYNSNHNCPALSVGKVKAAVRLFAVGCRCVTQLTLQEQHFVADMESKREEKIKFWFSGAVWVFWSNGRGEWLQAQVTLEWICACVAPIMIPPRWDVLWCS